ncbi:MAG TPA: hypothetical protein VFO65_01645 [Acidimicrobiales bacterium]|nr:hypothetical protein [Acidimicrobiales bacterium]
MIPLPAITAWFAGHGISPDPPEDRRWDATDEERRAADERIAAAQASGVSLPVVPASFDVAVEKALAGLAAQQLGEDC